MHYLHTYTVGNFKRPNPDDITDADLFVNIEESWNSLENEVIAEGFLTGWFLLTTTTY